MSNPLSDSRIPLAVRLAASNAALNYINAKILGDVRDTMVTHVEFNTAVENMRICLQAAEMGMHDD